MYKFRLFSNLYEFRHQGKLEGFTVVSRPELATRPYLMSSQESFNNLTMTLLIFYHLLITRNYLFTYLFNYVTCYLLMQAKPWENLGSL